MRKIIFALMVLCVVIGLLPVSNVLAADPFLVSQSLFYVDIQTSGTRDIELYIHNTGSALQDITIEPWYEAGNWYAYPLNEQKWMDVAWISELTPRVVSLPARLKSLINVSITLPEGVADGKYVGWLKISNGAYNRPISLVVRVGSAIPTYDFSITQGSYYRLSVNGMPAYIEVNQGDIFKPIVLKSIASCDTIYQAYVFEMGDRTISSDSAIQHTPEEIGLVFKEISVNDSKEWLTLAGNNPEGRSDCTIENPLKVGPFGQGVVYWKLALPDSLPDGNYVIHVRITPAGNTGGVTINCDYSIPFFIQVDRSASTGFKWAMWMTALVAVAACAVGIIIMVILEKRKKREEKREEIK